MPMNRHLNAQLRGQETVYFEHSGEMWVEYEAFVCTVTYASCSIKPRHFGEFSESSGVVLRKFLVRETFMEAEFWGTGVWGKNVCT
jgi:hypothetical protein